MPITLVSTDPFIPQNEGQAASVVAGSQVNVRRPLDGLTRKDPVYASLSLFQEPDATGALRPISLINSSAPGGWGVANHNFLLTGMSHTRQEKSQIVETFGATFVYAFGERAIVREVQGILLDTDNFNWKSEWLRNYDQFLRGTRCIENRARVTLAFQDTLVEGFILATTVSESSDQPMFSPFSFTMLQTRQIDTSSAAVASKEDPRVSDAEYLSATLNEGRWATTGALGESVQTSGGVNAAYAEQLNGIAALQREFQNAVGVRESAAMAAIQAAMEPTRTPTTGATSARGSFSRASAAGAVRVAS